MLNESSEFKLSSRVKAKLNNPTLLKKELIADKNGQEILEFSEETMAKFYKAAYQLFENKSYLEASHAFLFLSSLNPKHHEYWLGLGMSIQMCHEYERAIDAYELAALADISSPVPYFYLAKCLFAIHDRTSALEALELAIENAGEREEFQDLKKHAESAKVTLLKDH